MSRPSLLLVLAVASMGVTPLACRGTSDAERRQAALATAEAEQRAQEASLTSAVLDKKDEQVEAGEEAERARGEVIAAFRLEQSDYRSRLQRSLDLLDADVSRDGHARRGSAPRDGQRDGRLRDLRERRDLLKEDLLAVDRSTEQDWATLRTKVERDLQAGRPGAQLPPRTDHVTGEAP